jgi:uncharacterized membrane protein
LSEIKRKEDNTIPFEVIWGHDFEVEALNEILLVLAGWKISFLSFEEMVENQEVNILNLILVIFLGWEILKNLAKESEQSLIVLMIFLKKKRV